MALITRISLAAALLAAQAEATSLYIAQKCRGHTCTNTQYPLLDFDPQEGKCICRQHPCWNDNGNVHSCPLMDAPYLTFSYSQDGTLSCGCSPTPWYSSVHLAKDICGGSHCDSHQHPVLDYDEKTRNCICRANPCWDLEGMKHGCSNPKAPILRYREDLVDGVVKPVCECVPKLELPGSEKQEV